MQPQVNDARQVMDDVSHSSRQPVQHEAARGCRTKGTASGNGQAPRDGRPRVIDSPLQDPLETIGGANAQVPANGTMLRITAVSKVANPGYTVLGWRVADVEAAVHALTLKGVEFTQYDGMDQDLNGIWTTPGGDKVAWFTDPEGNNVSLTEFV